MPESNQAAGDPGLAQAVELAQLVELEARWENLAKVPPPGDARAAVQHLRGKQRAHEAYRARLAAYNARFKPAHLPEVLTNAPVKLGKWCRAMRDLFARVALDPRCACPAQVVERAHRWADRIALVSNREPAARASPPADVRDAIRVLEGLAAWCAARQIAVDGAPGPRPPLAPPAASG
jgi:hypothetical protein